MHPCAEANVASRSAKRWRMAEAQIYAVYVNHPPLIYLSQQGTLPKADSDS